MIVMAMIALLPSVAQIALISNEIVLMKYSSDVTQLVFQSSFITSLVTRC